MKFPAGSHIPQLSGLLNSLMILDRGGALTGSRLDFYSRVGSESQSGRFLFNLKQDENQVFPSFVVGAVFFFRSFFVFLQV